MRGVVVGLLLLMANVVSAVELRVFAAASLREPLEELARDYERRTGEEVVFSFGASSMLARQIQEGAPADLFLSADDAKVAALARRGLIVASYRVLSNSLVIVVPGDARAARRLIDMKAIALAEPSSVPAGIYARQYLERIGLWTRLAPKLIPTDNVRSALAAVEAGNADAAFVYKTDARIGKHVRVAFEVPRADAPEISYPFALVKGARSEAVRLLSYLRSPFAMRVFARHGFIVR